MTRYRVVDLRSGGPEPQEHEISGSFSAEQAAAMVLGRQVVRSGLARNLAAKVYFDDGGGLNLVRLYYREADRTLVEDAQSGQVLDK